MRERQPIKTGMILCSNGNRPAFYEVVGFTPSGKTAIMRCLSSQERVTHKPNGDGVCWPIPGVYVGAPFKGRLTSNVGQVKCPGYQCYAYPWDGKPEPYTYNWP